MLAVVVADAGWECAFQIQRLQFSTLASGLGQCELFLTHAQSTALKGCKWD
jgi:hypothetical protein